MSEEEKPSEHFVEQEEKVEYYSENRSNMIGRFLSKVENPKEPAIAGTIVLAPIAVTLIVVDWLFDKVDKIPGNVYFNITENFYVNQSIKLTAIFFFMIILVTGVGRFVKTRPGFTVEKMLDGLMSRIPLIGSVYNISKVTFDTVLSGPEGFKKPAKLQIGDLRVTGFKTGNKTSDGRDVVFVPTSPNITSGFVLEVPDTSLVDTDETAEEALTRVLSAGFGDSKKKVEEEVEDAVEEDEE